MKSNPLLAVLVGALGLCAAVSLWMSVRYFFSKKELQQLQAQAVIVERFRSATYLLVNDAVAYSQHNHALVPLLEDFRVLQRVAPATTPDQPASPSAPR